MDTIFDLVVRGGAIVDGTGAEPFAGDVAVRDGVIVAIGQIDRRGDEEVDASGLVVTPGFVDVHTHYDGQVTWENRLAPSSSHGVTTVVMGNCGVGFAPVRDNDHELMIKLMEGVEDIPDVVMAEGVPFNWSSFPEYLDALEKRFCDVDFATQIPHSPLRVFVMGERGAKLEPPTEFDLKAMRACVREAVEAGALGVSTSRNLFHRFRSGALSPCVATPMDELLALSEGLRDAGAGVFQCNPNIDADADADAEMRVFETVARRSGRPVNFSLIFTPQRPDHWPVYVARTRAARASGLRINAQFLPRPMGLLHGLDLSYHLFCLNPSYRAIAALPLEQKVARMRDPDLRARLLAEGPEDPNPAFVGLIQAPLSLYEMGDPADYDFDPEDSLQARAARDGRPFKEVVYDSLLKHDGHMILCAYGGDVPSHLERTADMIGEDNMIVALGDGGAHYAMICDAAYSTYMLANRLGQGGLDLPTTIRALTSQPAASLGLCDRGILAPGYKADLNIIDPDKMLLRRPRVACDLPAGGKRLHQASEGYAATIVSGVVTYRDGEPTGALPGRLVRGARPAPQQQKPMEMTAS